MCFCIIVGGCELPKIDDFVYQSESVTICLRAINPAQSQRQNIVAFNLCILWPYKIEMTLFGLILVPVGHYFWINKEGIFNILVIGWLIDWFLQSYFMRNVSQKYGWRLFGMLLGELVGRYLWINTPEHFNISLAARKYFFHCFQFGFSRGLAPSSDMVSLCIVFINTD